MRWRHLTCSGLRRRCWLDAYNLSMAAVLRAHLFAKDSLRIMVAMHATHLGLAFLIMRGWGEWNGMGLEGYAIAMLLSRALGLVLHLWFWRVRMTGPHRPGLVDFFLEGPRPGFACRRARRRGGDDLPRCLHGVSDMTLDTGLLKSQEVVPASAAISAAARCGFSETMMRDQPGRTSLMIQHQRPVVDADCHIRQVFSIACTLRQLHHAARQIIAPITQHATSERHLRDSRDRHAEFTA